MYQIITVILSFILVQNSFAQLTIIISGSVKDSATQKSLPFASVSIAGRPVGTVTNENGDFDFLIPEEYRNDTLLISHVGYKNYKQPVHTLSHAHVSIHLKPQTFLLDEIEIREKELTAKEIIAKAAKNLKFNYSTKPYCLEGFFREIEEENGKYVMLMEAAVDIYDKNFDGLKKYDLQESVDVREIRRSLRYGGQENKNNIAISLTDLLENNDVRYNRGMLDTAANEFSIDTITTYNDRLVYGISMSNKTDFGTLYVDTETFGVWKINMERRSRDGQKYYDINRRGGKSRGRKWFIFTVEFERYEGLFYPRRMHESEENEIFDPKTKQVNITAIETMEFVVTKLYLEKENSAAKRLRYGMQIKHKPYNKEFWKSYNMLKLTPLHENLIHDLEKELPLQEQFEKEN